ncbi:H-NS histone family protein [Reyranella sp.]|uniref:H-NS histone family protein n=1 Tax=Reyranella sp. TaxID=1929291 RepID=UPI0027205AC1|nr:H-NS histone family protein [Reyranella sp.]MDO8973824.1 H-NS histone family protein [Reyranella sp.]
MPRKASLSRIEAQIRELQAKADALKNAEKPGMKQLKAVLKKYKLDLSDVKNALTGKKTASTSKLKGKKVPPKYRNPANKTETWTGRGRQPKWVAAAIKTGKKIEDLAI